MLRQCIPPVSAAAEITSPRVAAAHVDDDDDDAGAVSGPAGATAA